MIHLNIEGKTWPEVTEQLAGLVREHGQSPAPKDGTDYDELEAMRRQLDEYHEVTANLEKQLRLTGDMLAERNARIAELEQLLATPAEEVPAENPTTAAEPEQGTCNSADASETDGAMNDVPAPATTEPEQPTYDKVKVREFLAECRNKGVNITDVLKPFGGRFPVVKEEDYPALMEAAKKALAEKGAK